MRLSLLLVALAVSPASAAMPGLYGPYAMTREASGTSWQPESTPHDGIHLHRGAWMMMAHGSADLVYDKQGGPRGGEKNFVAGMGMLMGRRALGPGVLGLRGMLSVDPAMGPTGYPLLFQTGETANGREHLTDRQHPHDAIMELAASYSIALGEDSAAFAYFGLPGEPALGPPAFMHRFSGAENPEAPISHHWLDSTHIAEGVSTLGVSRGVWKLEGSVFTGRESDQYRWDVETPKFDSYSGRLSWNPTSDWALQASYGRIESPEKLTPDGNQRRFTMSASLNTRALGILQQTTVAYGRTENFPGTISDAFLLEAAATQDAHTVFARAERVEKGELFEEGTPFHERIFTVDKGTLGYRYDFARWKRTKWGAGALVSVYRYGPDLRAAYGTTPVSFMLFVRAKLF